LVIQDAETLPCSFYPGQVLKGPYACLQKHADLLAELLPVPPAVAGEDREESLEQHEVQLTVLAVTVDHVNVSWSHRAAGPVESMPPADVGGADLNR
jgi:hypothetical protein